MIENELTTTKILVLTCKNDVPIFLGCNGITSVGIVINTGHLVVYSTEKSNQIFPYADTFNNCKMKISNVTTDNTDLQPNEGVHSAAKRRRN